MNNGTEPSIVKSRPTRSTSLSGPGLVDVAESFIPFDHLGNLRPGSLEVLWPHPVQKFRLPYIPCHDCPWLSFGKQPLDDHFETCWNVCLWQKSHLSIFHRQQRLKKVRERVKPMTAAVVLLSLGQLKLEDGLWWTDGLINSKNIAKEDKKADHFHKKIQEIISPGHLQVGTQSATRVHRCSSKHVKTLSLPKWMSMSQWANLRTASIQWVC